ncbi:hypothetical protein [Flavobacterium branchiicola]|uniref:Uncharacterized protein n=1 Tax=Flavobacterium branchiicola TaxID=1114875 RepID=A0ABV9PHU1_9FLAO|nr:hypothetical protein [Flavobacterium branchiicola]MBS7255569.1 hypothetical protein [Flavobacterium branchiicola]
MLLKKHNELRLKKYIVILFLILVPSILFSQSVIEGKWSTKNIIGYSDVGDYSLVKEKESNYGRHVTFNSNSTFLCGESLQCLNDCFVSTSGTYTLIDSDHVRIIVNDVGFSGLMCGMKKVNKEEFIKDLGIFYIYKEGEEAVRLISSNGILQDDKDKMLYNQLTYDFYKAWKKYDYVWQNTNGSNLQEIINDCVDSKKHIDLSNCKVAFSTKRDSGDFIILQDNKEFYYVVYDSYRKKVSLAYPKNKG